MKGKQVKSFRHVQLYIPTFKLICWIICKNCWNRIPDFGAWDPSSICSSSVNPSWQQTWFYNAQPIFTATFSKQSVWLCAQKTGT